MCVHAHRSAEPVDRHHRQWSTLRSDRSLITNAVHEVVRLASPLRAFSRRAVTDTAMGNTRIDAGARMLVLFASANRDERFWSELDSFDSTRDATPHLGFGYGVQSCAGQGSGRMETTAVLYALFDRVTHIERRGEGERAINYVIFPMGATAAEATHARELAFASRVGFEFMELTAR